MNTDEAAFLRAILEAPGDDAPRLVYADWLDERGEGAAACDQRLAVALRAVLAAPDDDVLRLAYAAVCDDYGRAERAEFIRVQVELARLEREEACDREDQPYGCRPLQVEGKCLPCQRKYPYRVRESELLAFNWKRWMPAADNHPLACGNRDAFPKADISPSVAHVVMTFRCGFVESVTCTADAWLAHGDALCAAAPVREVRLTTDFPPDSLGQNADHIWFPGRPRLNKWALGRMGDHVPTLLLKGYWPGVKFFIDLRLTARPQRVMR